MSEKSNRLLKAGRVALSAMGAHGERLRQGRERYAEIAKQNPGQPMRNFIRYILSGGDGLPGGPF